MTTREQGGADAGDGPSRPIEARTGKRVLRRGRAPWLLSAAMPIAALFASAPAAEPTPPRAYEVITETVMPHLEEALRYATRREVRCLRREDLPPAFPILAHDSLKGCSLEADGRDEAAISLVLVCGSSGEAGPGTTGRARWQFGTDRLAGVLDVKLGGKNMTFSQRVTVRALDECAARAR